MRGLRRGISLPYCHSRLRATRELRRRRKAPRAAATIINGMRPRTIGRAVGIGVRVAGRIAGQRLAAHGQPGASAPQTQESDCVQHCGPEPCRRASGRANTTQASARSQPRNRRLLRPFRRVGGILWLEVTGAFFLLFAAVFALRLWQNWAELGRMSRDFAVAAAVVFLYLGVSSFWRARRR